MAYITSERTKTGFEAFSEAAQPYLQMAFEYLMKKRLQEPEEKRKQTEEQRLAEKEKRETITSVSKGEIPISAIPESIRRSVMRGRSLDTSGLEGRPEDIQALQNIPATAQIFGTPEFMKRVMPAEAPEQAQTRLMSTYAQQQQAINPYKALQGETITARQQISDLITQGIPWENIPIWLKIQAGYSAREGGGLNLSFLNENPLPPSLVPVGLPQQPTAPFQSEGLVEVTNPQGKKVRIKVSDLETALKQGYKR